MKKLWKRIAVATLAVLLLVGSLPASAKSATPDFAGLVEAGENGIARIDVLTEPIYSVNWIGSFVGQYAPFRELDTDCGGLVDMLGHVVMRGTADMAFTPYHNGLIMVGKKDTETEGNFEVRDLNGKRLSPLSWCTPYYVRTEYDRATGAESFLAGLVLEHRADETQREFLVDAAGHALIADQLGTVYNGLVPFRNGEKWGLWNLDSKEMLPCTYELLQFVTKDCLLAKRDGKYALIDPQGKQLKALEGVTEAESMAPLDPYVKVQKDGLWGLLDAKGQSKLDCRYTEIYRSRRDNRGVYSAKLDDTWYYLDDLTAHIQMENQYGCTRVNQNLYLKHDGAVDRNGKVLIVNQSYYPEFRNGLIQVSTLVDEAISRWDTSLYDQNLRLIVTVSTGSTLKHTLHSYAIGSNDTIVFYSVKDGTERGRIQNATLAPTNGGACSYVIMRGKKYALADEHGKLLTDFVYDSMDYYGQIDPGVYHAKKGLKWLLLNERGEELTPLADSDILFYDSQDGTPWQTVLDPESRGTPYTSYQVNGRIGFLRLWSADRPAFSDVQAKSWYAKGVNFCTNAGLMNGVSAASFAPQNKMTRAMLVRVLYNLSGSKCASYGFTDVPAGKWYTDAVNWAAANGIVNGVSATSFAPDAPVTREQMVTILHRYASQFGSMKGKADALNGFEDAGKVSKYAKDAMCWAISAGIVNGKTKTTVDPQGQATRAEIATILLRFVKLMAG